MFIAFLVIVAIIAGCMIISNADYQSRTNNPQFAAPRQSYREVPWYELADQSIAIRPYASPELATADANRAASFGWSVQSVTTSDGHVNVGRTVSGAVLTGGLSLLVGGSRTQGNVTVTFIRPVEPRLVAVA